MTTPSLLPNDAKDAMLQLGVRAGERIAVAVSGGADSVALALMLKPSFDVVALTVDHTLRGDSGKEAVQVQGQMAEHDIAHHILVWEHAEKSISSNIQAQARAARYDLMASWCASNGISYLVTAHHKNDQAETLLLRLARGSGVYGLAAMDAVRRLTPDVTLLRPLLDIRKDQLTSYLSAQGISWIEDPSNEREIFERVKARKLLETEPLNGITPDRLAETAKRLRRTREAIKFYEDAWLAEAVNFYTAGYAELQQSKLKAAPVEIIMRGLTSILRFAGGKGYGPRFEKLERLLGMLKVDGFDGCTLGGVKFSKAEDDIITIVREVSLASEPAEMSQSIFWDDRFDVDVSARTKRSKDPLYFGMLGQLPRALYNSDVKEEMRRQGVILPRQDVLRILPVFFNKERLIAVPHLGYNPDNTEIPVLAHRWLSLSNPPIGAC